MGKLSTLLRWKIPYTIIDENDKPIAKVWLRIIGDDDAHEAYTFARLMSADYRAKMLTPGTVEYRENIEPLDTATEEQAKEIIIAGQTNNITSMAEVAVERPELPKLEEVAVDADAPTLEEQEKHDALIRKTNDDFEKAKETYINERKITLTAELQGKSIDELRESAKIEVVNVMALQTFITEVTEEKTWRSVYEDEECKIRGFDSIEDFKSAAETVREQLKTKYVELERNGENVKN